MAVLFHDEKVQSNLKRRRDLKNWIGKVLEFEGSAPGDINIIITNDKNLRDSVFQTQAYFSKANNLTIAHERNVLSGHGDLADATVTACVEASKNKFSYDLIPEAASGDRS
ncbi:hypothetical protein LCGC14_2562160, partial [marine sediment metagenome]